MFIKDLLGISALEERISKLESRIDELEAECEKQKGLLVAVSNAAKINSSSIKLIADAIKKMIGVVSQDEKVYPDDDTYH